MKNNLPPLYYAIIGQFKDDAEHCAADIVAALESDYAGYKLLTNKDVEEALATAKENGILDENACRPRRQRPTAHLLPHERFRRRYGEPIPLTPKKIQAAQGECLRTACTKSPAASKPAAGLLL